MKKRVLLLFILPSLLLACNRSVISDPQTISGIASRMELRKDWLPTLPENLTKGELQCLQFLYAYMPLGDVADYDVEFYLSNVRRTLDTRREMAWGDSVPEREFLHFVLPVRVNNENLDSSRMVFYEELRERVSSLSMRDAILEVNHWCHEKVNYSPSDARTMSPLSSVCNATGRCGEESTFTVAALRAVGIPARQIYVPRWAHTDDNHAWVEAWAADADGGGKWYYMGACEPEPVLNTGWFDAPATRSLMMLTKVFGDYRGGEQVLARADGLTEISVTQNYAPVSTKTVVVRDSLGSIIEGANVDFTIYNYATYYPTSRAVSDARGEATLTAGLGDMVVFASKDGLFASGKLDFRTLDTLTLTLGSLPREAFEFDIVPPGSTTPSVVVSPEARLMNDKRFSHEDSIREAYMDTFMSRKRSDELAVEFSVDSSRLWNILSKTRGNYEQIVGFLRKVDPRYIDHAVSLLEVISLKDLRDTPSSVLTDHLNGAVRYADHPFFKEYILNPRVDNELLRPYRNALQSTSSVEELIRQAMEINVVDSLNPSRYAISALGVQRMGMADKASVERFLIASLRSNGIAARREPLSRRLQYYNGAEWVYIQQGQKSLAPRKGTLEIELVANEITSDPKLDTHFTLAHWNGSRYMPIEFESLGVDMGGDATLKSLFAQEIEIEEGHYLLTSGTRLANGGILARSVPISVYADKKTSADLVMRTRESALQVIGSIDPEVIYVPRGETSPRSLLSTTGRGYFILAMIDSKTEPTVHMMRDLARESATLGAWARPVVLVLRDKAQMESLNLKDFPTLPSTISLGYDSAEGNVTRMFSEILKIEDTNRLPIVVVADSFGRVVYISKGYNTSLGEQLKSVIKLL